MKIVDDTLKQDGKWSISRLMIFFTFWANLVYAGWCVWKTAVFVDLPTNWMGFMSILYGINVTAATTLKKGLINGDPTADMGK